MRKNKISQNEESKLLSSFEKGEWKTVKNLRNEKKIARKTAAKTLRKDPEDKPNNS